jgi:hypothetical protein
VSEAKPSRRDCFVAALLAMTCSPEFSQIIVFRY